MTEHHDQPNRRGLLKLCTHALGGLFAVVLGVPAAAYLVDGRHRKGPNKDFLTVHGIDLEKLRQEPKGYVTQGVLRTIREDAWTLHPNDVVGRVWIVKTGDGDQNQDITVLSTVCPHLGCSVNYTGTDFTCPCHNGKFELDGTRIDNADTPNPSPRGMYVQAWEGDPKFRKMFKVSVQKT